MKIKLNLSDLKKALKNVQKAIPSNPQLPILSSVLFSVADNGLTLAATDLYLGIRTKVKLNTEETIAVTIPGIMFRDLVNSFNDEDVQISIKEDHLDLKSGTSQAKLPVQSSVEYPDFPEIKGQKISVSVEVLNEILQMVSYASSLDQVRPILTTIMFEFGQSGLEVVATDGFRLAVLKYPELKTEFVQRLLIPAKSFDEVTRIINQGESAEVNFQIDQELKQIKVETDNNEIFIRLVEGEYPPYQKIIPESYTTKVEVDGESLKEELQRAMIFSREASNIVKFQIMSDRLLIKSVSPALGEYNGEIALIKDNNQHVDQEIAFDIRYLLDFLNSVAPQKIIFCMNESLKPAAFNVDQRDNFTYIVMPFRVNNS